MDAQGSLFESEPAPQIGRTTRRVYTWYWNKYLPERKGVVCRIVCRGAGPGPRNLLIAFPGGTRYVAPQHAVRRQSTLPCLSVRQPWADALVRGIIDVKNRSWPSDHRGSLLIHASKEIDPDGAIALKSRGADSSAWPNAGGAIIGMVTLRDCTKTVSSPWHYAGDWGWYVQDALVFREPVAYQGQLRTFPIPAQLAADALWLDMTESPH